MAEYKTITREQLKQKIDAKEQVALIDVLGENSYNRFHVPGAINIPLSRDDFTEAVAKAVPEKDKEIVVYCSSFSCTASPAAAQKLADAGFTNVYDFEGGLRDWAEANYPFEGDGANEATAALIPD